MSQEVFVIGVGGRSGSGKSTLVRKLQEVYGKEKISLHTMDNYYRPRDEQVQDEASYLNFDLPSSFYREKFHDDLVKLKNGEGLSLPEYAFNQEAVSFLEIAAAPIILVEGLFVYHYDEIRELMDYQVVMDVLFEECFRRRLKRDQEERNYEVAEIEHRYLRHAEPAYQTYIHPYIAGADLLINNEKNIDDGVAMLKEVVDRKLEA